MRDCGECTVCCEVGGVPEFGKPPYQRCPHQGAGCALHKSPDRPSICKSFQCAWLRGFGADGDRPDKIGAMFAINDTPSGTYTVAVETVSGSIQTTAAGMAATCARSLPFPVIVSKAEKRPPHDIGDYIVLRDSQEPRWWRNIGLPVKRLDERVMLYELRQ